jgi:hypothetical protein
MLRTIGLLASLLILLSSCVTFYNNPSAGEPAATFVEKGDRSGLARYRYFNLVEIDGKRADEVIH